MMNLDLPDEQQAFIESLVAAGRFASAGEAVSEAVRLLVSQERLKRQVAIGVEQAERGELLPHDTVFDHLRAIAAEARQ